MTYHERVLAYEAQGMTTSDAQSVVDVKMLKAVNHWREDTVTTKQTHTPGPWGYEKQKTGDYHVSKEGAITAHCIIPCWAEQEDIFNARLIASAPDLLVALTHIWEVYGKQLKLNDVVMIENAIAKAEGRTQR